MAKRDRYNPVEAYNKQEKQRKKKRMEENNPKRKKAQNAAAPAAKRELDIDQFIPVYTGPAPMVRGLHIPMPQGVAPETEGQIYHALTQLEPVFKYAHVQEPHSVNDEHKEHRIIDASTSKAVFSSAPILRDLHKESAAMVPASIARKMAIQTPHTNQSQS